MALSIKDPETDRLARELADVTGESITEAIRVAIAERLERTRAHRYPTLRASLQRIHERLQALPVLDDRSPDDMLYDEFGLPK
jgi:antitoxin VapB